MADKIQTLLVSLEARINQYESTMRKATQTTDRTARGIESRFKRMNSNMGSSFSALNGIIYKAFAGAAALRGAQILIDSSIRIENSLKVAGLAGTDLTKVYDALYVSAQKNAAPLEALTELYGRAALVQKELGVSTEQLLTFTDHIAVALRVSGKSAQESSGALLQLSQSLGSGTVRAEEFNSILEGALPIAQAAAAGLDEAGGSVAKLRQLVVDGKVSSAAFFAAFEAGSSILTDKVANAELTVSQGFIRLQNVLIDTAGKFNDSTGASEGAAIGLDRLANSVQSLGDYFERNAGRIKPFFDAIAAADAFDPSAFREKMGLGVIDDFLEGTSLIEGRFGLASQQIQADAADAGSSISNMDLALAEAEQSLVNLQQNTDFGPLQAVFDDLIQQILEGKGSAEKAQFAIVELGRADPSFAALQDKISGAVAGLYGLRDAALSAGAAASAIDSIGSFPSQAAFNSDLGVTAVKPVSLSDYKTPGGGKGGRSGGGKSSGEKFSDSLDKQRERNRLLQEETALQATLNPLVNDYGFALEKLHVQQELQTAATAAGITLTPALKASIDELATGYASATVEAAKLAESQDAVKKSAEDFRDLAKDATKGFISDLIAGKSAADALSGALGKIADQLLNMAIDSIFSGFGGGGGFGSIFGFAKGGIASGGKPLPMFAGGGVSNSASIFGEAGPEAAVPLPDGRRIPVDLRLPKSSGKSGSVDFSGDINITMPGASGGKEDQSQAQQVARLVKQAVNEQISKNMRSGGLLNPRL